MQIECGTAAAEEKPMDIKQIRKIIELMKANELCEFEMEEEGFRIAIKRRNGNESQVVLSNVPTSPMVAASSPVAAATAALASAAAEKVSSFFANAGESLV
jgi:biotin carboxyl carrier protein